MKKLASSASKFMSKNDETKHDATIHGWAYISLPLEINHVLSLFRAQFPLEWQVDNHGKKISASPSPTVSTPAPTTASSTATPMTVSNSSSACSSSLPSSPLVASPSPLLHVTFLLRMKLSPSLLDALKKRVAQEPIHKVRLGVPFFETVDRIKSAHVKCVGVPVLDPSGAFIKFRQSCADLVGASVGYPERVGHISLVYISSDFHEIAQHRLIEAQAALSAIHNFDITTVTICSQDSRRNTLNLINLPLGMSPILAL